VSKIVEFNARPSDYLALAVRCGASLYAIPSLWDSLENMSAVLEKMRKQEQASGEACAACRFDLPDFNNHQPNPTISRLAAATA